MHNFSACVSNSRTYWQQNSKPALSSAIVNIFFYHLRSYRDSIEGGCSVLRHQLTHLPERLLSLCTATDFHLHKMAFLFHLEIKFFNFLCNNLWAGVSTVVQKPEKTKSIFSDWNWYNTQCLHFISFTAWFISQTFWFWPSKTHQAGGKLWHWIYESSWWCKGRVVCHRNVRIPLLYLAQGDGCKGSTISILPNYMLKSKMGWDASQAAQKMCYFCIPVAIFLLSKGTDQFH